MLLNDLKILLTSRLVHLFPSFLPSSNILLDSEDGAKVGDFGLSKEGPLAGHTHISTSVKGTPGYLDPYYYLSYHLSTSSDVYSFGVILLQLVSAKPAVDHSRKKSQYNIITWVRLLTNTRFLAANWSMSEKNT